LNAFCFKGFQRLRNSNEARVKGCATALCLCVQLEEQLEKQKNDGDKTDESKFINKGNTLDLMQEMVL